MKAPRTHITRAAIERYLRRRFEDAQVVDTRPLGQEVQEDLKAYGYGCPLRIDFEAGGRRRVVVLRTMSPDPFGHDRRADRAAVLLGAHDDFRKIPQHIHPLDVGAFTPDGELIPMATGEIFLVTDYVEGSLYAADLQETARRGHVLPRDLERIETLARYLAKLHQEPAPPQAWQRALRDTVGSGEGIFGLCDSYPDDHPVATADRLRAIEQAAVGWRWRLRDRSHRSRRTHGDFHPFNLLFREGADLSVLDCSRGAAGDPADDVTCLSINLPFFELQHRDTFDGPMRRLWEAFWDAYLEASGDAEVLEVVAPWFAWRGLVIASPVWYPNLDDRTRDRLLRFIERLLGGAPFDPARIEELL